MSRITAVMILLVILVNSLCSSAASSDGLSVYIRKCRCAEISKGRFKCPKPLRPTNDKEHRDLINCICKTIKQKKPSDLQRFCRVITFATVI